MQLNQTIHNQVHQNLEFKTKGEKKGIFYSTCSISQVVLTGPESENSDVIQVKVEDYLEGAAGSFSQETLSQESK